MKKKSGAGRVFLTVLCVFLGLVLAAGIALTVYVSYLSGLVGREDGTQETLSQEQIQEILMEETVDPNESTAPVMDESEIDWGEKEGEVIETSSNVVNILLIGQDARNNGYRSRSDSMILLTFNPDTKTVTMTSFLRDMYVQIPGYGGDKLNHTYVYGGMPLLNQTLEQNFGVQVDGNVEVNFIHFAEVIDLMGGVDMELRADEAAFINRATERYVLGEGLMHLDGDQALYYSRIRHLDANADFSRTNRQRKVITALIEKFRNAKLTTLLGLLDDLLPMITTDMSNSDIVQMATKLFPMLSECTIVSQRVPADGAYDLKTIRGMSCVVADMDAARKLLEETLGG
jgi:LCP family protein required for cell wall assembly